MHHVLAGAAIGFVGCFMFLVCLVSASLYFVPSLVALVRRTEHRWLVVLANVLCGWSVIGWFASLLWACYDKKAST